MMITHSDDAYQYQVVNQLLSPLNINAYKTYYGYYLLCGKDGSIIQVMVYDGYWKHIQLQWASANDLLIALLQNVEKFCINNGEIQNPYWKCANIEEAFVIADLIG